MTRAVVTSQTIDYPDSDGLPMAEHESQFWPILYVGSALDWHFREHEDVYVVGNLLVYYQEGDTSKSVSPDLMVVFGAPKHIRSSYRLWEEPKAPDFVLEIASESTYRIDQGEKHGIYARMGVSEYWQCDPAGNYLSPPLQGFQLVEGQYEPTPATVREDGTLTARSEALHLELHLTPGAPVREALHFYDPVRQAPLRTYREEAQAREQAEARLREEQAARQVLEAQLRDLRRTT